MLATGGMDARIHNAVTDFAKTEKRLMEKDVFFHVYWDDKDSSTINIIGDSNKFPLIIEPQDTSSFSVQWNSERNTITGRDTIKNNDIIIVKMTNSEENPLIYYDSLFVNLSYRAFPDHLVQINEVYFFWFSHSVASVDSDIIQTLYQHNQVDTLVAFMFWPNNVIDDGKAGVSYSFPSSNLTKFRKRRIK